MTTAAILLMLSQAPATGCEVKRDKHGRIKRSQNMKAAFRLLHPCPATGKTTGKCEGYVIDHIWPLCAGGCDVPQNMQWQTKAESVRKDRLEWKMCREQADEE